MEEKITPAYARREYGVVVDARKTKVLAAETRRLRSRASNSKR
jgi:hypothetical protein